MSGIDFVVNTSAPRELLEGIAYRSRDMRPATRYIRTLLIAQNKANFASEGSVLGEPWPALAESTLETKRKRGQPLDPMIATGTAERALGGGRGKRTSATRTMARVGVGSALFYLRFHNGVGGSRLPTRRVIGVSEATGRESTDAMQRYLEHGSVL